MAYLEIPLASGIAIIETEDEPGAKPVSSLGDRATQALASAEASLGALRDLALHIVQKLGATLPNGPDEIELSFGVKASAEMSAFVVAKAQGEANFAVKISWKRIKTSSSANA